METACPVELTPAALYGLAEAERSEAARHGYEILTPAGPTYPSLLLEIPDPPLVLYIWGTLEPDDEVRMAIVGSRRASRYGLLVAEKMAADMAEAGITVVSGLARGIDAAAHRGALSKGGRTLAVLGSGLLDIYPDEHRELARAISKQGAVVSEFPLRTPPLSILFPRRNRIISGLSAGVVMVEAARRSGALGTARIALDQGREVFAVPGSVLSPTSEGTHRWLADGCAHFTRGIDDVLAQLPAVFRERLGLAPNATATSTGIDAAGGASSTESPTEDSSAQEIAVAPEPASVTPDHAEPSASTPGPGRFRRLFPLFAQGVSFRNRPADAGSRSRTSPAGRRTAPRPGGEGTRRPATPDAGLVLDHLSLDDPISVDDLAESCGLEAPRLFAALSALEIGGLIVRLPGNRIAREP